MLQFSNHPPIGCPEGQNRKLVNSTDKPDAHYFSFSGNAVAIEGHDGG